MGALVNDASEIVEGCQLDYTKKSSKPLNLHKSIVLDTYGDNLSWFPS